MKMPRTPSLTMMMKKRMRGGRSLATETLGFTWRIPQSLRPPKCSSNSHHIFRLFRAVATSRNFSVWTESRRELTESCTEQLTSRKV